MSFCTKLVYSVLKLKNRIKGIEYSATLGYCLFFLLLRNLLTQQMGQRINERKHKLNEEISPSESPFKCQVGKVERSLMCRAY